MIELYIKFPLRVSNGKLGTAWYPKRAGNISIYLANHSRFCKGDVDLIIYEVNITILEEISHQFHKGNCPEKHDYAKFLKRVT